MDLKDLLTLKHPIIGRIEFDSTGHPTLKYTALDPATDAFTCTCERSQCDMRELIPFREHTAQVYRAVAACEHAGILRSHEIEGESESWDAVTYQLQMAASLEDVFADTAYVDASESTLWCGDAADFEARHSEITEKYITAMAIFNFVWGAYEGAVRVAGRDLYLKDKTAVRGRKLAADFSTTGTPPLLLPYLTRCAERYCRVGGGLDRDLDQLTHTFGTERGPAATAELARLFRNHIAHGRDRVPLDTDGSSHCVVYRFYGVSKLLLLLIQLFASKSLMDVTQQIVIGRDYDSDDFEDVTIDALTLLTRLHLSDGPRVDI